MFTFFESLFLAGIGHGVILTVALRFFKEQNKAANSILSVMEFVSTLMLIGRVAVAHLRVEWVWSLAIMVDTVIFLFGPLLYMYIRRLLFVKPTHFQLRYYHFIPAIIHFAYAVTIVSLQHFTQENVYASTFINYLYFLTELFGILSIWIYIINANKLFSKTASAVAKEEPQQLVSAKKFLKALLFVLGVIASLWGISFISYYAFQHSYLYLNYEIFWISIPVLIYLVGYYCLQQPEFFRLVPVKKIEKKPTIQVQKNKRLTQKETETLTENLVVLMERDKLFLDHDLSLNTLAQQVGTTSNNLSWLLNQTNGRNFYDYVNAYRIKEFIQKVENKELQHTTILGLAMDVGFNSKSTFNKVFKNTFEESPSSYIKRKKEEEKCPPVYK